MSVPLTTSTPDRSAGATDHRTGWRTPTDPRADTSRRLFAQELVSRMASVGSATEAELLALPILVLKVPPTPDELGQTLGVARRLGWLEHDTSTGEWHLTDAGKEIKRPPSLAVTQVATRILSVANPVRNQAKDWLPALAIVTGTVTAGVSANWDSTVAIRWLAVAVLACSVGWQFVGEWQIMLALRGWRPDDARDGPCRPLRALYSIPRLLVAALLDAAAIAAFALAIFGHPTQALVTLAGAAVLGLLHLVVWTGPAAAMVCEFQQRDAPLAVRALLWRPWR